MKQQISLKLFVTLAFLVLGATLVIGYSLLSTHYYRLGMDSVTASNMEGAARNYLELVPQTRRQPLENFRGYQVAEKWENLPQELRLVFSNQPTALGLTIKEAKSQWYRPPEAMYFVYRYQKRDENLYIVRHGTKATAPPLIGKNAAQSRHMLLAISGAIAAIMGGVIMLLLRRVSRPVAALGQWARSLNPGNLSEPPPDFSYPELNELAELMRNSLSSVQESLDREHNFLRHASHELRTPIAVIRNNIELLHKIKENRHVEKNNRLEKVVDRIDRAGMNMQYLTETLLWLSRTEMEALPGTEFELDRVLAELVEEMQYLLDRKDVDLTIETSTCSVCLPEFPVRIVLGNLIRNAFQHTWEGTITIRQQGNSVAILNPQTPADNDQQNLGFGLGLQLTDQLTRKLGWHYEDTSTPNLHRISIVFGG